MSETHEVVVVGGGMFGSAGAKYLSRAGAAVTVIGPAEPSPGTPVGQHTFGAHFDEARITRRLGWDQVWGTTDARSLERYRDIEAESGIGFFHECGSLVVVARSIARRTGTMLRQCADEGIEVQRLSEAELRAELPDLGILPMTGGTEGLLERKQAGYLNPRRLVQAQLRLAQTAGARLLRAAVTAVEQNGQGGLWQLRVEQDGGSHEIWAHKVLICTGALTNQNGVLPAGRRLALHAFTEPNLLFEVGEQQLDRLRKMPSVVTVDPDDTGDDNMSLYLLPPIRYPDGKWYMRIGPGMQPYVEELHTTDEMVQWYARQQITPQQAAALTLMMKRLVPSLEPVSIRAAGCIIEKTPSRYPYIGHLDEDHSFAVAVGGNGHGARGSDEIGRLAASVLLGAAWDSTVPEEIFTPLLEQASGRTEVRPDFLKPPFGLC